jgi:RNA-directed DNA polymerase
MLTFANVVWGARCGESARRVLLGETRSRDHAYSVRRRRESAWTRQAPPGLPSPRLVSTIPFDRWMRRQNPQCPFARYADDAVVHCRSRAEAERLLAAIAGRLKECKLELHPEKSGVVYCKDSNRRGKLPSDTVYVPGVHVPAETRPRPRREVLDELPACGECSGDAADVSHP